MSNECEIIDNVACGKPFKFCKVHRVEPHDCPGAKRIEDAIYEAWEKVQQPGEFERQFEIAPRYQAPVAKREFKVGDKVRLLRSDYGSFGAPRGYITTLVAHDGQYWMAPNPTSPGAHLYLNECHMEHA